MENEDLKEAIKTILLNNNFCDEELLDNCAEELMELLEDQVNTEISKTF